MWTRLSIPPLLIPTSFDVNNIREYEKNRRKKNSWPWQRYYTRIFIRYQKNHFTSSILYSFMLKSV